MSPPAPPLTCVPTCVGAADWLRRLYARGVRRSVEGRSLRATQPMARRRGSLARRAEGVGPGAAAAILRWQGPAGGGRMLRLRCKARSGTHPLPGLTAHSRLRDLQAALANLTGVPAAAQRLLLGFPPRGLDLSDAERRLGELGIHSGGSAGPLPSPSPLPPSRLSSGVKRGVRGGKLQADTGSTPIMEGRGERENTARHDLTHLLGVNRRHLARSFDPGPPLRAGKTSRTIQ